MSQRFPPESLGLLTQRSIKQPAGSIAGQTIEEDQSDAENSAMQMLPEPPKKSEIQKRIEQFNTELARRKDPKFVGQYHYDKLAVDIQPDGLGLTNTQEPIDYINEYQAFMQRSVTL